MFCLVVEEGSVSKVARLNYKSQPAVTRQIRQLENSYGTTLFDRVKGKLSLTEAGELLYPYAKEILTLNKVAYEGIHEYLGREQKTLQIGASFTIGEYLLPALIGNFTKLYPDIKFSLSIGNTPQILIKLEENEIDLALVESAFTNEKYKKQKFADDELILVTAYNHRWEKKNTIHIDELREEKMIWREKESGMRWVVVEALKERSIYETLQNPMELGSIQAIKSAVEAELGMSILPRLTVQKELKFKTLREVRIQNFNLTRDFWMVQKKRRFKHEALQKFEAFLMR